MDLFSRVILISVCISSINTFVTERSNDNANYQVVEAEVEEEFDENGNSIYKAVITIEDSLKKINENFNQMQERFIEDQGNVFDSVRDNIEEYKNSRDYDLNLFKDKIDDLNEKYSYVDIENLENKKSEIEESIADIQNEAKDGNSEATEDMKMTEVEYRDKLDKLKERKYQLTALMTQHCDNCDEIIREYQLDVELAITDKDILELEENFRKQAEENEKKLKDINVEKAGEMIVKYSQLVDVLNRELEMYKKREEINEQNVKIINEWKKYSEYMEYLHTNTRSKIEDLTKDSLVFSKIISGYENNEDTDENKQIANENTSPFRWIQFEENSLTLPENLVEGCEDIDGSPLFVIRKKRANSYLYGKYAFSDERKNAYVTNDDKEFGVTHFEILTAINYSWCETDSFNTHDLAFPICRARFLNSVIPGTLLEDGRCRIGFEWGIKLYSDFFDVLIPGECNF